MKRRLVLATDATVEPLTLDEAKAHLRAENDFDNGYITTLIKAARLWMEEYLGRVLLEQEWELVLDDFYDGTCEPGVIELAKGKLRSITSITYIDIDGGPQTLPGSVYDLDKDSIPGRVFTKPLQVWPATRGLLGDTVRIKFKAGYGTAASDVPAQIRQAMFLVIGQLYENREMSIVGNLVTAVPFAVEALVSGERLVMF